MTTVLIAVGLVWLAFGLGFCCGAIWHQRVAANAGEDDLGLTTRQQGIAGTAAQAALRGETIVTPFGDQAPAS